MLSDVWGAVALALLLQAMLDPPTAHFCKPLGLGGRQLRSELTMGIVRHFLRSFLPKRNVFHRAVACDDVGDCKLDQTRVFSPGWVAVAAARLLDG